MSTEYQTVLAEVLVEAITFEGRKYVAGEYFLMDKDLVAGYGDSVRVLTRDEQLAKEAEWV